MALTALLGNKLRSSLTMLGIIIGVAAVIAMISVGQGAMSSITATFDQMAPNVSFVQPSNPDAPAMMGDMYTTPTLTVGDAEAIADIPGITAASANNANYAELKYGDHSKTAIIRGTDSSFPRLFGYKMGEGYFISDEQVARRDNVIVLGSKVAEDIFDGEDPLGREVKLRDKNFTVIGVLAEKGGAMFGFSMDDLAAVPISTYHAKLFSRRTPQGEEAVDALMIEVSSIEAKEAIFADIEELLRRRHNLKDGDKNDFAITSPEQILDQMTIITTVLTFLLGAIAAISLLVAGIGIMNIMLVSVTERTREIGLRKAVGARRRDILLQFLMEAGILSLAGGIIGIGLGILLSRLISTIDIGIGTTLDATVSPTTVVVVIIFSFLIGMASGGYPAIRAARLNPIDALRFG